MSVAPIDLAPFCLDGPSISHINEPWCVDGKTYATDGRIAIEVDAEGPPPKGKRPGVFELLENHTATEWHPCPEVEGPPEGFDGRWVELEFCNGCDCGRCSGNEYESPSEDEFEGIEVFSGLDVGRRYLWLVSQLPNVEIGVASPQLKRGHAIAFRFDGGRGLLIETLASPTPRSP